MEQKFKRGNLVKILVGNVAYIGGGSPDIPPGWYDMQPELVNKFAVIIASYHELYGGGDIHNYKITYLDTGITMAWKQTNEMEFVDDGGEYLIEEAKKTLAKNLKDGKLRPVL